MGLQKFVRGLLGRFCEAPGALLGGSWVPPWKVMGASWLLAGNLLRSFWKALRALSERLESFWEASGSFRKFKVYSLKFKSLKFKI